jgi:hypothetical protein
MIHGKCEDGNLFYIFIYIFSIQKIIKKIFKKYLFKKLFKKKGAFVHVKGVEFNRLG